MFVKGTVVLNTLGKFMSHDVDDEESYSILSYINLNTYLIILITYNNA